MKATIIRNRIGICLLATILLSGIISEQAQAQTRFGLKGGLNISSVHLNSDMLKADNITGFRIGPMVEVMLIGFGLGLDAALLYAQKGMDLRERSGATENVKASYLEVPVNLKWKFGVPLAKLYVAAGPYVDFRIGGNKFWVIPGDVVEQVKAKTFSAGINAGLGAELLRFLQVGGGYSWGLTDNYQSEWSDVSTQNRGWLFTATILF